MATSGGGGGAGARVENTTNNTGQQENYDGIGRNVAPPTEGSGHSRGGGGAYRRSHMRSVSHGGTAWSSIDAQYYSFSSPYDPYNSYGVSSGNAFDATSFATTKPEGTTDHGAGTIPFHQLQHSILMNPSTGVSSFMSSGAVGGGPPTGHRTHQRTFSHGQTIDGVTGNRGHRRAGSKTDFILPDGHEQREKQRENTKPTLGRTTSFPIGHKRNASRTESIYTIRENKIPLIQRIMFWRKPPKEQSTRTVVANHILAPDVASPNDVYPSNRISTTKYTLLTFIPKNIIEQFHRFANIYFLLIVLLNFVPSINAFAKEISMTPLLFVLCVTAMKDLFEDRRRYNSDKRVNNSTCRIYCSDAKRYLRKCWKELRVGDVVHLSCNEAVPADLLLLNSSDPHGICYLDSCNLDGETNLKQRQSVRGLGMDDRFDVSKLDCLVEISPPTTKIYHFLGSIPVSGSTPSRRIPLNENNLLLRSCFIKNTDYVEGLVVYAGHETKVMLNNSGPRYKMSLLERYMNTAVIWCVGILLIMCLLSATGAGLWQSFYEQRGATSVIPFLPPLPAATELLSSSTRGGGASNQPPTPAVQRLYNSPAWVAFLAFWTFVIIYQTIIPIALYVTIEIIKILQVYHIHQDPHFMDHSTGTTIECRAMNITEELGQIQYLFTDKTGTLTENNMVFQRCSINGVDYHHQPLIAAATKAEKKENDRDSFMLNQQLYDELTNPPLEDMQQQTMLYHQRSPFLQQQEQLSVSNQHSISKQQAINQQQQSICKQQQQQFISKQQQQHPTGKQQQQHPINKQQPFENIPIPSSGLQSQYKNSMKISQDLFAASTPLRSKGESCSVGLEQPVLQASSPCHVSYLFNSSGQSTSSSSTQQQNVPCDNLHKQRLLDFFLTLALCNTVIVAKSPHKDQMTASGVIIPTPPQADENDDSTPALTPSRFISSIRSFQPVIRIPPLPERPRLNIRSLNPFNRPLSPIASSPSSSPEPHPKRLGSKKHLLRGVAADGGIQSGVSQNQLSGPVYPINEADDGDEEEDDDGSCGGAGSDNNCATNLLENTGSSNGGEPKNQLNFSTSSGMSSNIIKDSNYASASTPSTTRITKNSANSTNDNEASASLSLSQFNWSTNNTENDGANLSSMSNFALNPLASSNTSDCLGEATLSYRSSTVQSVANTDLLFNSNISANNSNSSIVNDINKEDFQRGLSAASPAIPTIRLSVPLTEDIVAASLPKSNVVNDDNNRSDTVNSGHDIENRNSSGIESSNGSGVESNSKGTAKPMPPTTLNLSLPTTLLNLPVNRLAPRASANSGKFASSRSSTMLKQQSVYPFNIASIHDQQGMPANGSSMSSTSSFGEGCEPCGAPASVSSQAPTPTSVSSQAPSPADLQPIYEAESPDELALVDAAHKYGVRLLRRSLHATLIDVPGKGLLEYEVLHVFPFDSTRKRMSIVVRHPLSRQIILYCKGADSAILENLSRPFDELEQFREFRTQQHLYMYSKKGLRTLCVAMRVIAESDYNTWALGHGEAESSITDREYKVQQSYKKMERELVLLGATGIEDRLQPGVSETLAALRAAGIMVWLLTGDKQETAINVAYSAALFTQDMQILKLNAHTREQAERTIKLLLEQVAPPRGDDADGTESNLTVATDATTLASAAGSAAAADNSNSSRSCSRLTAREDDESIETAPETRERGLVVDGKTLIFILDQRTHLLPAFLSLTQQCSSVLISRATPLQKALVVKLTKQSLGIMTLAVGDGANDVSMIQTADVGVGISGVEGRQAVMASDFAITRFSHLHRLLLLHGHWCYDRFASIILYYFYKNANLTLVLLWYQFYCCFSGNNFIDQMYLIAFGLFFTSIPPIVIGVYDKDTPSSVLLSEPKLYSVGRLNQVYKHSYFWVNILDAFYQSLVMFFFAAATHLGTVSGLDELGTTVMHSCLVSQLLHVAVEIKSWTILHVLSLVGSLLVFHLFIVLYTLTCVSCFGLQSQYGVWAHLITSPRHWLIVLITAVTAVLPRFVYRGLQSSLYPSAVQLSVLRNKQRVWKARLHREPHEGGKRQGEELPIQLNSSSSNWGTRSTGPL
uniref:P-type phospholipid transporter n=2 Tax=Hirondellea gigas TaxID=1518452 RepID=A0A6A7G3R0_9CRUS